MVKQLNKHLSYAYSEKTKELTSLTFRDFLIFRKKLCGVFIFKGKRTLSIKTLNYILFRIKLAYKGKKGNPMAIFFLAMKRLTPFLTLSQNNIGKRVINVPSLLYGNKKNILLLNWTARQFRDKSNIYGINKEDVLKSLLDTLNNRGTALRHKIDHNRNVLLTRINLKNEGLAGYDEVVPLGEGDEDEENVVRKEKKGQIKEPIIKDEWDELNYLAARDEFLKDEVRRLNPELQRDDQVYEKLLEWKAVEPEYDYLLNLKDLLVEHKKRKEFVDTYKRKFVK